MNFFKPRFWDKKQISVFSIFLLPISITIQIFSKIRNLSTKCKKFSIPVICVGNIYLGGTGKTPVCIELNNILKNLNKKTAYVRKKHDIGNKRIEKTEICFLSQNLGLKKFIFNY